MYHHRLLRSRLAPKFRPFLLEELILRVHGRLQIVACLFGRSDPSLSVLHPALASFFILRLLLCELLVHLDELNLQ
jgi:hypothetical protein